MLNAVTLVWSFLRLAPFSLESPNNELYWCRLSNITVSSSLTKYYRKDIEILCGAVPDICLPSLCRIPCMWLNPLFPSVFAYSKRSKTGWWWRPGNEANYIPWLYWVSYNPGPSLHGTKTKTGWLCNHNHTIRLTVKLSSITNLCYLVFIAKIRHLFKVCLPWTFENYKLGIPSLPCLAWTCKAVVRVFSTMILFILCLEVFSVSPVVRSTKWWWPLSAMLVGPSTFTGLDYW